jgi:4-hydroxybenzoate polyprenyltransferase
MTAPASPRPAEDLSQHRRWPWVLAAIALVVVIVWPLQALALAMLITAGLMMMSIYGVLVEHGVIRANARVRVDRWLPVGLGAALVVSALAAVAWPTTLTPIAFLLLVALCATWLISEWLLVRRDRRAARHDRD